MIPNVFRNGEQLYAVARRKQILPRPYIPYFEQSNPAQVEDFYRRLCLLFKPFNNEGSLRVPYLSYEDAYRNHLESLPAEAVADIEKWVYVLNNF